MAVDLSILIPTIPARIAELERLLAHMEFNGGNSPRIEILALMDTGRRSIGDKRNQLITMSIGRYFAFVDDDDIVSPDYFAEILSAIDNNPGVDCITFTQARECVVGPKVDPLISAYDHKVAVDGQPVDGYYDGRSRRWIGIPSHTCVWRKSAVDDLKFEDSSWQEDLRWMRKARYRICTIYEIPRVLYVYNFDPTRTGSATRNRPL